MRSLIDTALTTARRTVSLDARIYDATIPDGRIWIICGKSDLAVSEDDATHTG